MVACKVMLLDENTTDKERKTMDKEMRVHVSLKHENVLEFINGFVVDLKFKEKYFPGVYMLLELAAGGDLFDKIGIFSPAMFSCKHYLHLLSTGRRSWRRHCPLLL